MSIEAGNLLRENREQKGISIKEASDALHIRIPYLQALENGRAEIIPSNVQARGFLRIYAEFLHLDPAEVIQEWDHPGSSPLSQRSKPAEAPAPPPTVPAQFGNGAVPSAVPPQYNPDPFPNPLQQHYGSEPFQPPAASQYEPAPVPSGIPSAEPAVRQEPFYQPQIPPEQPAAPTPVSAFSGQSTMQNTDSGIKAAEPEKKQKAPKERKSLFGRKKTSEKPRSAKDPEEAAQELFTDIGQQLSYRRQFLSLSLEDCEAQTLIRSIYIESMENGKFDQLPSFIQARGMLNNYASFLDLDVEEIMLKLATALQLLSQKKNRRGENKRKQTKTAGRFRKFFTPDLFVGIFVIVGLAGIIIYSAITIAAYRRTIAEPTPDLGIRILDQYIDSAKTPDFLPTVSPTAAPVSQNQTFITDTEETESVPQEMVSSQPVQIFITANQRALMRVVCDGKEVFSGRTIPNNTYPFDAESLIELTTGNADALSVVYNQQNLGRLGKTGEVITIDFSPFSAATPTPQFSPTPTNTYEPTYTPLPETPLPTNTPTPYIP